VLGVVASPKPIAEDTFPVLPDCWGHEEAENGVMAQADVRLKGVDGCHEVVPTTLGLVPLHRGDDVDAGDRLVRVESPSRGSDCCCRVGGASTGFGFFQSVNAWALELVTAVRSAAAAAAAAAAGCPPNE